MEDERATVARASGRLSRMLHRRAPIGTLVLACYLYWPVLAVVNPFQYAEPPGAAGQEERWIMLAVTFALSPLFVPLALFLMTMDVVLPVIGHQPEGYRGLTPAIGRVVLVWALFALAYVVTHIIVRTFRRRRVTNHGDSQT